MWFFIQILTIHDNVPIQTCKDAKYDNLYFIIDI